MATTTNFGWTTPDDTALVKDGAAAIRSLGSSIDSTMAELKGGTTGQVLSKTSNTDMDFTWVAQDDSNAIQNAIVDAKGDLISATANDTPARLAVGTDGQYLSADSSTATGLKWATVSAEKPISVPQNSGRYIRPIQLQNDTVLTTPLNRTYYLPVYLPAYSLDRIGFTTGASALNISVRLGIYNASATTGLPSTVYLDAGTVNATATGTDYLITISSTPPAGYYYLALNTQTITSGTASLSAYPGNSNEMSFNNFLRTANSLTGSGGFLNGFYQDGVTGAFATAGTLVASNASNIVRIAVRMA